MIGIDGLKNYYDCELMGGVICSRQTNEILGSIADEEFQEFLRMNRCCSLGQTGNKININ